MKSVLVAIVLFTCYTGYSQKKLNLFNGKDLIGWSIYVSDSTIAPSSFFYVNKGVIETIGVPTGYLRTYKEFENYHLHIEWRYPEKPTNSGIFIHTNGGDKIWPTHYQCQLKHLNAGDFIVQGSGVSASLGDSVYTSTDNVKPLIPKIHESSEKNAGEWNAMDVDCKGNSVEIRINGVLQNVATNCSLTKGSIGLQAEGSKIQFRNLWIKKIR